MNCTQARELMSAFFDGEVSSELQADMASHFADCQSCSSELSAFGRLSALAQEIPVPTISQEVWEGIESQLSAPETHETVRAESAHATRQHEPQSRLASGKSRWTNRLVLAVAATILIGLGWLGYHSWFAEDHEHAFELVFAEYLDEFRSNPDSAQAFLLANYDGTAVPAEDAIRTIGYRPMVAEGLPPGYSIAETYVMNMPCCTCVQCVCKLDDGTTIVIFEHDDEDPHWFGEREKREEVCGGKPCQIVDLDDSMAATWQQGSRHVTVVGLRETDELARLVAWFEERNPMEP